MVTNISKNIKRIVKILILMILIVLLSFLEEKVVLGADLNIGDSYTANLYDLEYNNFLYCNDLSNTEVWAADPSKTCTYKVKGYITVDTTQEKIVNVQDSLLPVVPKIGKTNAIKIAKTLANQKLNDSTTSDLRGRVEGMMNQTKIDEMIRNGTFNHWLYYVFMHPEQVAIWELHGQAGIAKYEESSNYVSGYGILDAEIEDLADLFAFMAIGTMPALDETSTLTEADYENRKTIEVDQSVNPKTNYNISDSTIKDKIKNFPDGCDPQDYISVGPYKYSASKGDYIEKIEVKKNGEDTYINLDKENTDVIVLAKTKEGNYSPIYTNTSELLYEDEIGSDIDTEFYVLVKKNSNAISIKELKIEIGRMDLKATWYYLYGERTAEGKTPQRLLIGEGNYEESFFPLSFEVNLIPPVQVELNKVDTAGTAVEGAKFSIIYSNGLKGETKTADKNGKITFPKVQPTSPDSFTATITETGTPAGYKPLADSIVLTFTYNESKAEWEVTKTSEPLEKVTIETIKKDSENTCIVPITVENKSIIEKLTILKTSSIKKLGALEGAKFKLTLSNVANVKNYKIPTTGATQEAPKTIYVTTDSNGNIVLEDIEIANLSEYVVITIEEIEAPVGYKKIEGKITLTLKRTGDHYTEFKKELDDTINISKPDHYIPDSKREFSKLIFDDYNHTLEVDLFNIPIMNLGGIVWYEDEKTGKNPSRSDIYGDGNGEEALSGIKVYLYEGNNKIAETTSSDGTQTATYTNHKGEKITVNLEKGQYMFTDVTAGEHYHMEFEYDGIKYEALKNVNDEAYYKTTERNSKIYKETNRYTFNASTKTISGNGNVSESITNAGWIIKYDLVKNENNLDQAIYKGVYNEADEQQFVTAKTWNYLKQIADWKETWKNDGTINTNHYAFNINCGLNKKYFDLNLGTDVEEATVIINGNQTTYKYDQILDGKLDEALNKSNDSDIEYNLYLAHSDYNYRISDYKVPDEAINNKYDTEQLNREQIDSAKGNSELEIYVTYKLQLKNQSPYDSSKYARVKKIEYHFDDKYEFVQEKNTDIELVEAETDINNGKLMIDTSGLAMYGGKTETIKLTFKVKPDNENKCKMFTDYLNQAEIVSYETFWINGDWDAPYPDVGGGLVDADSAPGNAFLTDKIRYEDDTDEANGIQIKFKENAERTISGSVFVDSDRNSRFSSWVRNDTYVNDVIVQLIELVEIGNKQYEYIWQETVSGSNTVKTTARNGYTGSTYNVYNDTGKYKFTERIIPGNYIVRFIYGDGTYFETNINGASAEDTNKNNIKKYNGEDYKSTYAYEDYEFGDMLDERLTNIEFSHAFDNEARRLRVMSYGVDVDGTKGEKLALLDKELGTSDTELKDVLDNTWMCADTQKIKVPVDFSVYMTQNGDLSTNPLTISDNTVVEFEKNDANANSQPDKVEKKNVCLGLMERPKTKLVLEKHITGLTIKPVASGVGLIANATANISDILTGDTITLEGQKDELTTIKSSRTERGFWKVETDTTELAQGADAYITYTYVIKNEGDEDYLNKDLVEFYNAANIKDYATKLSDLELEVKNAKKSITEKPYKNGTYISDFYYTGTKGDNDKEVLASVEQIQEALNPKVSFVNSTTDFSIIKDSEGEVLVENKNVYKEEGTGTKEEEIKEQIESVGESVGGTKKLLQTGKTLSDIKQNKEEFIEKTMDTSKKLVVSVGLSASEIENGGVYDSYIAQITHYTNAAGRRDQSSTPANLSYVHSYDTDITLENYNEEDEFWAERFIITKPTGEDKLTAVQIAIISVSAVVILGVGIILIKKFVLKK